MCKFEGRNPVSLGRTRLLSPPLLLLRASMGPSRHSPSVWLLRQILSFHRPHSPVAAFRRELVSHRACRSSIWAASPAFPHLPHFIQSLHHQGLSFIQRALPLPSGLALRAIHHRGLPAITWDCRYVCPSAPTSGAQPVLLQKHYVHGDSSLRQSSPE